MGLENELAKKADKILICDTDLLETKVYSEEYYGGFVDPDLDRAATESQYDLYLLSYIDTPWEADDLRDRPTQREEMFRAFERALENNQRPYVILKGRVKERMNTAVQAIDKILTSKRNLDAYSDKLTH